MVLLRRTFNFPTIFGVAQVLKFLSRTVVSHSRWTVGYRYRIQVTLAINILSSIFSWSTASRKNTDNPLRGFLHAVGINLNKEKISLAVRQWFESSQRRIFTGSMQAFFTLWKPRIQPRCKANKKNKAGNLFTIPYLSISYARATVFQWNGRATVSLPFCGQKNYSAIRRIDLKVYSCVIKPKDCQQFLYYCDSTLH